jgi:hypothetical protein
MSEYSIQDIDFVKRTLCILEQYKKSEIPKEDKFEITLFVNCLLGLILIPKSKLWDKSIILKDPIETWGIKNSQITTIEDDNTISNVLYHLRNSIAHYRFELKSEDGEIKKILFCDKDDSKATKCNFEAIIPISNLRTFIDHLVKYYLQEMEQSTNFD